MEPLAAYPLSRVRACLVPFVLLFSTLPMSGKQAFPQTDVGECELKTLPAGMLLKSQGSGSYFAGANGLFMPLFRYISSHNIAMTTPVEAQGDTAAMFFWVAEAEQPKVIGDENGVSVVRVPERRVASMGGRGSYDRANFEKTRDTLLAWLRERADVEQAGPAYAGYWNAPFVPWFLKRFEVHIPVRDRPPAHP